MMNDEAAVQDTDFRLSPAALSHGYSVKAFASTGSTNDEALEGAKSLSDDGRGDRCWYVTTSQKSGRGRRGRQWDAPEGNLAASLLLVGVVDPQIAATLGFVAGLALAEAVDAVLPEKNAEPLAVALKWPNDLLVNGAKLSGILLETVFLADGRLGLAIGMGTNIVAFPPDLPYEATCLKAMGAQADATRLFLALSDSWCHFYQIWDGGGGLDRIRRLWLERAYGLGKPVALKFEGRIVEGVFETIDSDCRLIIRQDDGIRTAINAGDVHFGTVASLRKPV